MVLYAVDLDELRRWAGCRSEQLYAAGAAALREDEDASWEPEELAQLDQLLRRLVFEGQLYEGLEPDRRYYLTQLLIDLFDSFVDHDAVSEEIPHRALLELATSLPPGEARRLAGYLARGRELGGDEVLWHGGPVEDHLALLGYVTRDEVPLLAAALSAPTRRGSRPTRLARSLRAACEECARSGLDLVSFIG